MENPLVYQITQLLRWTNISFDKEELAFQIQSHPSFPSLHAVTGILEHFNIDNVALDVPQTEEVLNQLPDTFLAQMELEGDQLFAVIVNKGEKVDALISSKRKESFTIPQFLEKFTGIIVAIEKNEEVPVLKRPTKLLEISLSVILGLLLVTLIFLSNSSISQISYLALSVLGAFISGIILKKEFGLQTDIGDALCIGSSDKADCNAVLSSKGATFGNTKLSDISWVYFVSLSITTVISIILNSGFTILLAVSILATPVIIYSVFYQYTFAKAWCILCLIVAGIIGIQAMLALYLYTGVLDMSFNATILIIFAIIFLSIYLIWSTFSLKFKEYLSLKKTKLDYFKFKRNFELFKTMLFKSPSIDYKLPNVSEIILGDKNAPLSIVIVTSPFCKHCKSVHTLVENILQSKGDQIAITIRFNVNTNEKENVLYKIIGRLTEIYHEEDSDTCLKAMHEIYEGQTPENWFASWGNYKNTSTYDPILNSQNRWCLDRNIHFTPCILIEGRTFPKEYDRQDLKLFIDDLIEMHASHK